MIQRHFLDGSEPVLPALAHIFAEERAGPSALDLGGELFVLPGRRPARRWIELLVAAAEDRSVPLHPPGTTTPGAVAERLYRPDLPPADGVLARRAWSRALAATPRSSLERLLPEPPGDDDPAGLDELAGIVEELHYELMREGLLFREVEARCGPELLFDDSERWAVLAEVQERYRTILREARAADLFESRVRALEEGRIGAAASPAGAIDAIHLVGVVELPGVVRRILEEVSETTPVTAWIHAPERFAGRFDALGCVRPEEWSAFTVPVDPEHLVVCDDPAQQADEVLRAIAGREGTYPADEVVIGAPDREVVPRLEQRLGAHGVPHRDAAGTPLERSPPFRLLDAVASYLESRRFADLAALLRHPDFGERVGGPGVISDLDRHHGKRLPAGTADLGPLLERVHGPEGLGPLLSDGPDEGARTLSETMPPVLDFLAGVYADRPLDGADPRDRERAEVFRRIREVAAAFYRLPSPLDPPCGPGTAIRLFLSHLRGPEVAVPPEPRRAAVEILGWLELHLDDAPVLLLTGANEGRLPGSLSAHPFLPDRLRSRLGIPDDEGRRARDAYLLAAALESRRTVRVIAGRRSAGGDPLRPSRLLLPRGDAEALAERFLLFVEPDPAPPRPLQAPRLRAARKSGFRVPPEPRVRLEEVPSTFHVTEFRSLLADPYRWYLERRLGLEAVDDGARELDGRAFGALAHRVLEAFARTEEVDSADPEAVARRLDFLLDRIVTDTLASEPLPAVPLQVEQLRRRLRSFAPWHAGRVEDGWRVVAAEAAPPRGGVSLDVDGAPARIVGRVDRVEHHSERGELAVFDYKTGDSPRDPKRVHRDRQGEWRDLQLPLYRHLLPHLVDAEGSPVVPPDVAGHRVRLGYIHLPGSVEKIGARFAEWDEEDLASALERARSVIRALRSDPVLRHDPERSRPSPWDPLAPLLDPGVVDRGGSEVGGENG